jgi:hypothetical protein
MGDLTYELLTNREQFPDTREITLADGQVVTVKELRDTLMPKADMTRMSQSWAEEKRQLQESLSGYQRQLAQAASRQTTPAPSGATGLTEDDYLADPVLGPIFRRAKAAEERLAVHEQTYLRDRYQAQLTDIEAREAKRPEDKRVRKDQLLDYAIRNNMADLNLAYRVLTRDRDIEMAQQEALRQGIEKGRKEATAPHVPFGNRRSVAPTTEGPKDFDSAEDAAMRDPDILAAMRGDSAA